MVYKVLMKIAKEMYPQTFTNLDMGNYLYNVIQDKDSVYPTLDSATTVKLWDTKSNIISFRFS